MSWRNALLTARRVASGLPPGFPIPPETAQKPIPRGPRTEVKRTPLPAAGFEVRRNAGTADEVCPDDSYPARPAAARTTKSALEQRSIEFCVRPILVHPSDQPLILDNRYNGGSDHQ